MKIEQEELKSKAYLIAHNHVHGLTDALTDSQEKKDLTEEILQFAELYHQSKVKIHNEALHIGCVMLSLFERHEIDALIYAKDYDNLGRNLTEKEMDDFYNKVEVVKRSLSVH